MTLRDKLETKAIRYLEEGNEERAEHFEQLVKKYDEVKESINKIYLKWKNKKQ